MTSKSLCAAFLLLLGLPLRHATSDAWAGQPAFPRYSLFNTQIRFLHSSEVGRVFKIFVNLP